MPGQDESTRNGYEDGEDKARWVVANMLEGTGLEVEVRGHELVIINPDLRDRGRVHVDFDGGHVSWEPEHQCFHYWGTLEGFEDVDGAGHVTRDKIIATLTAGGSTR
jgi:hypothetical protein